MGKVVRMVQGIGIKGTKYGSREDGKPSRVYTLWLNMLRRCTKKYWDKYPTYTGTTCSENFKSFTFFYEWCQTQIGFMNTDGTGSRSIYQLDKDLLGNGSKVYSEDTCCFVPPQVNSLLLVKKTGSAKYPRGISKAKRVKTVSFEVVCGDGLGSYTKTGCFRTLDKALEAYKLMKESVIKEVANEYKEQLDSRVYEALMNYEVNEND